jgi:ABC-type uncharacterized transport system substrate-binding protein
VKFGLVESFNRPGGNITGSTGISVEFVGKQLGLLRELLPRVVRFAALVNPASPEAESTVTNLKTAALAIGGQLEVLTATTNREIDAAYATLPKKGPRGSWSAPTRCSSRGASSSPPWPSNTRFQRSRPSARMWKRAS